MIRSRANLTAITLMLALMALPGCALLGAVAGTAVSAVTGAVDAFVEAPVEETDQQPVEVATGPQAAG